MVDTVVADLDAQDVTDTPEVPVKALEDAGKDGAVAEGEGKDKDDVQPVPFKQLFRFADNLDVALMIIGGIAAFGHGSTHPLFIVFFGQTIDSFAVEDRDQLTDDVAELAVKLVLVSIGALVGSYLQVACFVIAGQRQATRLREQYFRSLVRQDISWYDEQNSGRLNSNISSVPTIQEAISDKFGAYIQFMAMFIVGFIVGFVYGWKLALVILSVSPLLAISGMLFSKILAEMSASEQKSYSTAGSIADEVLRLVITVMSFGADRKELSRYKAELDKVQKEGIRSGLTKGLSMGFTMFVIFGTYGLAFWYGGELVRDDEMSPADVLIVFFSVITAAMALGQAAPSAAAFATGRAAAAHIYKVIDREPVIDSLSTEGERPDKVEGGIEFQNLTFAYPTRPNEAVIRGLSLKIEPRSTVAFVGPSGCGKSTLFSLLERFYDPQGGEVQFDGRDIRGLNIQWLRQQFALVSQEPILFPTTIFENIASGKDGATRDEVIYAAKVANAHDFISSFPDGYETQCGDQGMQLSGGQKQRISIARAVIKNPHVLLLDEATSALDNESESLVQDALETAGRDRTTLVIAHRLSTIFTADVIVVIKDGGIVEQGSHADLMQKGGVYFEMVQSQHRGSTVSTAAVAVHGHRSARPSVQLENVPEDKAIGSPNGSPRKASGKQTNGSSKGEGKGDKEKEKEKEEEEEEEDEPLPDVSLLKWGFRMNKKEWPSIVIGIFFAFVEGLVWPAFAVLLGEILNVLINENNSDDVAKWAGGFGGVGVLVAIAIIVKSYTLAVAGEKLTTRLRMMSLSSILSHDASYFDNPKNSQAVLNARLQEDAHAVKGLLGERLGLLVQQLSTVIGGLVLAFVFCWEVSLVVLGTTPLVGIAGALQLKLMTGIKQGKEYEPSVRYASQAVSNIRTVLSLGRASSFVEYYNNSLQGPLKKQRRAAHVQGTAFGFSEMSLFLIWALAFWFGAQMVDKGRCSFADMMKAMGAIVFGAMMAGQINSLMPDAAKARRAAGRIYNILDQAEPEEETVEQSDLLVTNGLVEFRNVNFTYPSRPNAPVLRNFSLTLPPGKTTALVGRSGCGKSTVIRLLERFYQIESGDICVDGRSVYTIPKRSLRRHIALVTQEPQLFSRTIGDNIAYGLDSPDQDVVVKAAESANATEFIDQFEKGYDTVVGEKGLQLSGGQRQRTAIARALARDKIKILLLDEATSALDTRSEILVHEALERARQGRTTLIIAHRLSTVQSADSIAVVDQGQVIEQGTHDELMAKQGAYYDLVNSQQFAGEEGHSDDGGDDDEPGEGVLVPRVGSV